MKTIIFALMALAILCWLLAFISQVGETRETAEGSELINGSILLYSAGAVIAILAELMKALS